MTRMGVSIICIVAGLATAAGAAAPSRSTLRNTSWGKAGVSIEDYRADAADCARQAVNLDVSNTEAAKTLVAASRAIDTAYSTGWMYAPAASISGYGGGIAGGGSVYHDVQQLIHGYRVDQQFGAIGDLQYRTLDTCLAGRGYHRFRLTADQVSRLRRLREGSDQRRAYLHSLGSNSEILSRQAV